ncbi:MAG TPA: M48 family metalloprotease, partial [Burkholderiales bacterium]|nr:M48 family metalloprotease [Burkholderiales bacterium]
LKEADPHAWVIPRLYGRAKAAMVAIEFDEFGGGRADEIHAQLFADLMADLGLETAYGHYVDAALQRYVNNVGRWLASQSERPDLPWQFGVLDAPEVNAFAVPGGTVFVTNGLVQRMQSEAQLAGVLAHEISHVLRKHHLKAIQKGAQTALAGEALQQAVKDPSGMARDKLISLGSELYTRGLDKSDEFEADRLGVVIAARGGYDSYGLPAVLQTLQAMNAQDSALAMMFKTHPSPTDRLGMLSERMQPVLDQYATQPQLPERFVAETKKLR